MICVQLFIIIKKMDKGNDFTAINQAYKIWKKHSPFLYSILQTYQLPSCSQTVDWFSDTYIENDWKISNLLIASNSISENALQIMSVGLPTDDSLTDYSTYRQQKPSIGISSNGFIGIMGVQELTIKISIHQASEVMKARINRFDENLIAVKIGGANTELIIYDLRNKEEELQNNCIRLEGHTQEGFGLSWSPHQSNKLLSASYDKKILLYNIEKSQTPQLKWESNAGIQDAKWSNFNAHIFASAHLDHKIMLWDIRQGEKPFISRKAHDGQVYSLEFNRKTQFLLLSAGEDGDVNLWDVRNMSRKLHGFIGHNDSVNVVSWSPHSSTQFASGSSDNKIVVWDMSKLNQNSEDKVGNEIVFIHGGHRSKICDLSWNIEKDIVSSCEEDNRVEVWRKTDNISN